MRALCNHSTLAGVQQNMIVFVLSVVRRIPFNVLKRSAWSSPVLTNLCSTGGYRIAVFSSGNLTTTCACLQDIRDFAFSTCSFSYCVDRNQWCKSSGLGHIPRMSSISFVKNFDSNSSASSHIMWDRHSNESALTPSVYRLCKLSRTRCGVPTRMSQPVASTDTGVWSS